MTVVRTSMLIAVVATAVAVLPAGAESGKDAETAAVRARLKEHLPNTRVDSVRVTPIPGVYELRVGSNVAYVSADGRYLIQGDLYDIQDDVNLTDQGRAQVRLDALDRVDESSMIIFEPAVTRHTITVFTDLDCAYCRKLHRQIDAYNADGVRVRYMFFPRNGPNTSSWTKAERVWCSEDRHDAFTRAKRGESIEAPDCGPTPVMRHYRMGQSFGIRGTPAIVTETGRLIPGYVSPDELSELLEKDGKG